MPHEDYVPAAPHAPDHSFDPSTLYQTQPLSAPAKPPEPPPSLSPRLLKASLALALAGVVCLLVGERSLAHARATEGWMKTSATIVSAKLRAAGKDYHLDLAYRYRAGPREHQGARLALDPALSREAAYAYAERFRPGAKVPAWFDPAAPESVVLERPNDDASSVPRTLGALLLVAGLAPFVVQLTRLLRYRLALRRVGGL